MNIVIASPNQQLADRFQQIGRDTIAALRKLASGPTALDRFAEQMRRVQPIDFGKIFRAK